MRCALFRGLLAVVYLLSFEAFATAQTRIAVPVRNAPPDLGQVTRAAGIIFAGRVLSIQPLRLSSSDQVASVEITFQVEQAVRGARAGEKLSIREWTGLWTSGERYRIGERLLLFLYAPSALGLTSPVGGSAGRFAVDRDDRIVISETQRQSIRKSTLTPVRIDEKHPVPLRDFTRAIRRVREE